MFRGDPAHRGVYATEGPQTLTGVKWAFKTGAAVLSSPAIADGMVFFGSDDHHLYAVDLATGLAKWKYDTGGQVRCSPAVAEGLVFTASYGGKFHALDVATGQLRWSFDLPGERRFAAKGLHGYWPREQVIPDFWDVFQSSPAVVNGVVYFGCGDGHVYALEAATGAVRWTFATGDVVHSSPAVVDGMVYVGSWDTYLYALDAGTGALKWKFKTGDDPVNFNQTGIQSSPCIADGVVYIGSRDFHLYAVDAKTGEQKWKYHLTWINASPVVHAGRVYCNTSIPAVFFALDAATGREVYQVDLKLPAFSSPALAGNRAYVGSFNGKLYAIDVSSGKIAWEFQTAASKANAQGALTAEGGFNPAVLFTSRFFDDMYVSGNRLLSLGAIVSSPVVDNGVVYVGSADGHLYALE
jgi:eukaryotic-like serine/threonine-protein kinase